MEDEKMSDDEVISAVSGKKLEEVEKSSKRCKKINELRNKLMEEIHNVATNDSELLTYIYANISTILVPLPKEARGIVLSLLLKHEAEGKSDELMKQINRF